MPTAQQLHQARRQMTVSTIKLLMGCSRCGYDECAAALSFHHRPGEVKLFDIGGSMMLADHRIRAEIDKCDLLCSNCHMEVTHAHRR